MMPGVCDDNQESRQTPRQNICPMLKLQMQWQSDPMPKGIISDINLVPKICSTLLKEI